MAAGTWGWIEPVTTQPSLFDLDPDPDEPAAVAAPAAAGPAAAALPPAAEAAALRVVAATDGSCSPNPGPAAGAWYVGPDCWGVAPVDGPGTNNIGELAAIRALLEAVPPDRRLEIVFDSTYARDCLTVWIHGWSKNGRLPPAQWTRGPRREPVKNAELIGATAALLTGRAVTWTKAKAHVTVRAGGHALNHEADRLAGDAVTALKAGRPVDRGPGFTG